MSGANEYLEMAKKEATQRVGDLPRSFYVEHFDKDSNSHLFLVILGPPSKVELKYQLEIEKVAQNFFQLLDAKNAFFFLLCEFDPEDDSAIIKGWIRLGNLQLELEETLIESASSDLIAEGFKKLSEKYLGVNYAEICR